MFMTIPIVAERRNKSEAKRWNTIRKAFDRIGQKFKKRRFQLARDLRKYVGQSEAAYLSVIANTHVFLDTNPLVKFLSLFQISLFLSNEWQSDNENNTIQ